MNCTLTRATSAELNTYGIQVPSDTLSAYNAYATAPMVAVLPSYQPPSEEELYTSFEDAISQRSSALLKRPTLYAQNMSDSDRSASMYTTQRIPATRKQDRIQLFPSSTWQRYVVMVGLALIFMLIGFDLMGLLILHMH